MVPSEEPEYEEGRETRCGYRHEFRYYVGILSFVQMGLRVSR